MAEAILSELNALERKAMAQEDMPTSTTSSTNMADLEIPSTPTRSMDDGKSDDMDQVLSLLERIAVLEKTPQGRKDLCLHFVEAESEAQVAEEESKVCRRRGHVTTNEEEPDNGNWFTRWWARTLEVDRSQRAAVEATTKKPRSEGKEEEDDDEDLDQDDGGIEGFAGYMASLIKRVKSKFDDHDPMEYATYGEHGEYPDYRLHSMMKLLKGEPPSQYSFNLRKWIRVAKRALRPYIAQKMWIPAQIEAATTFEQKHAAIFTKPRILFGLLPNPYNVLPRPPVMDRFDEDTEMARQFIAGLHPVMICVCARPTEQLTPALLQFFQTQKINVQAMASENRLFYVRYDDLLPLEKNPHDSYPLAYNEARERAELRYFHPAIIVFELEATKRCDLDILAIQLDRNDDEASSQVFSKATCDAHLWTMAKTCVTNADSQIHEWVSHLGDTHLTMEPHIIAIHNTLRKEDHPLFIFFEPLLKDTLFLNFAARDSLAKFGPDAFGDKVSSVGIGQYMQIIHRRWQTYSFFEKSALPQELASRGFTEDFDMPGYLYREDGMKLWKAMGDFCQDVVAALYPSDHDVQHDAVLQHWATETTLPDRGAVPGFPTSFDNRHTLARVMQTLMWLCSGLHAAVNFPQYDYLAYTPNKPLSQRRNMDLYQERGSKSKNPREWIFRLSMPYVRIAQQVQLVVRLLTLPSETCIDNLERHFHRHAKYKGAYQRFLGQLDRIGDEMEARNQTLKRQGKPVYPYLHPSKVPASIDI